MSVAFHPASAQESLSVLGDTYRLLLTGAETGGQFSFIEVLGNPGSFVPPHIHDREDEAFHIIEGQMEVTDASGTYVAGPGDSVFLPRGEMHSFRIIGDGSARFYIHAVPAGIEVMFREINDATPGPPNPATLVTLFARYGITVFPPPGCIGHPY